MVNGMSCKYHLNKKRTESARRIDKVLPAGYVVSDTAHAGIEEVTLREPHVRRQRCERWARVIPSMEDVCGRTLYPDAPRRE